MKKIGIFIQLLFLLTFIALPENTSAQVYVPGCTDTSNLYSTVTGQPCSQIIYPGSVTTGYGSIELLGKRELSVGSRGGDVRYLQQFLKAKEFLFGRDDGVFGAMTQAALINYQRATGLTPTGVADGATFTKMEVGTTLSSNTQNNCSVYYISGVPQYTCANNNTNRPTISSLSPASGTNGTLVTIYGSNFTYSGNTVTFGNTTIPNLYSYNGINLTFTVPNMGIIYCFAYPCNQTFNVSVTNANGISSNSLYFTVQ